MCVTFLDNVQCFFFLVIFLVCFYMSCPVNKLLLLTHNEILMCIMYVLGWMLNSSPLDKMAAISQTSVGKPVCKWPGHHHSISGGIAREADPLEDQHGTNGTSGQYGQNQDSDIWPGARCASEVWWITPWCVSQGRRHKLHFIWWLFQLDPQEMQWYPWISEAWHQLLV